MRVRRLWLGALAALALLVGGRASAFNIVFNGPSGYGVSASSATSAQASGVPIIAVTSLSVASDLGIVIPAPDVLSFDLVSSPSVSHPITATSQWTVNNTGEGALDSAWLVFTNPETYTASQVGFEIDPNAGWALLSVVAGQTYYYPAVFLGDVASGDATTFLMHHRVGQALTVQQPGGQLVLPKYHVAALEGLPVPEPAALVLLAAGFALAAAVRRRNA